MHCSAKTNCALGLLINIITSTGDPTFGLIKWETTQVDLQMV